MRIYIWEGDGISSGYHDNGTLVILAESPEQARKVARTTRRKYEVAIEAWHARNPDGWQNATTDAQDELDAMVAPWDGEDKAIDREPDRVVEIDAPRWIAFNGGGYD